MGQSVHLHYVPALSIKLCFYNTSLQVSLTFLCSECEKALTTWSLSPPLRPSPATPREGSSTWCGERGCTLLAPELKWGIRSRLTGELTKIDNNDPIYMAETHYQASYQYVGLLDFCQQIGSPVVSSFSPAHRKSFQLKNTSGKSLLQ